MNIIDITNALDAIKALTMTRLNERTGMLVALLAEMVDSETSEGEGTELNTCLEGQDWWNTLNELTKDAGFERLGNGHFSAAYSHPLLPNKVIKVGFKKEDSGAAYVAFCRMHQGRPGIPNIYDVQRHAGCYTVVLDELQECDQYGNDTHEKYADMARDVIEYGSQHYDDVTGWDAMFVETCKEIRKFFNGIASFDMHAGNIMFTHGGVPYITDPVSFTVNKEKTLSIEPEELLQEIEQLAAEKAIDKAIERNNRKAKRLVFRKAQRMHRKARKVNAKNHKKNFFEWRQAARMEIRNENRAKDLMGLHHWQAVWPRMMAMDFKKLEERAAAAWVLGDHIAIQAGQPLNIDKQLDAMFMG